MTTVRPVHSFAIGLTGFLLLVSGIASNLLLERTLGSETIQQLSWGPILFRLLLILHGVVLLIVCIARFKTARNSKQFPAATVQLKQTEPFPWVWLLAMSMLALILRLWRLNTDLWFDELLTLINYVRAPFGYILTRLPDQNNHILFSVLSHISFLIFGESAWSIRLPSVLLGVMSLWPMFLLGRRLIGKRDALFACALMTVSYHHIWFSQNARGYMALLFFTLLSTWLWSEALERRDWKWWIAYAFSVAAGMLTHLTMAFVVAAHAVVFVVAIVKERHRHESVVRVAFRPAVALALSASITLQFYALALPEFLNLGLHEVSLESEWTNPLWIVTETIRNLNSSFAGIVLLLVGLFTVALGFWQILRRDWQTALLLVTAPVLAGGTMLLLGHNLWPRFFFFSMGFALLIVIRGCTTLPAFLLKNAKWQRLTPRASLALPSLVIAASICTLPRNYAHPKQDYSGARNFVESHRSPEDNVVAVGLAGIAYKSYFAPSWSIAQTESELAMARRGKRDVWLVYTLPVEVKAYRSDVWRVIQRDFTVVKVFPGTLGGGELVVCKQSSSLQQSIALSQARGN